jgi:hypothetical protein
MLNELILPTLQSRRQIWRVESDLVAMYRERGLETFEFLCGYSVFVQVVPINSCPYMQRMSVYIDQFYSEGSLYIYCCFLPRKSLYCQLQSLSTRHIIAQQGSYDVTLQIQTDTLLLTCPQFVLSCSSSWERPTNLPITLLFFVHYFYPVMIISPIDLVDCLEMV